MTFLDTKKKKKFNKYIVLLDTEISHPQSLIIRGEIDNSAVIEHYKKLNLLLDYFAKIYKKRIIISIHPASDINKKKILFPRFKIEKYKTRNLIYNASLVLFFESSAILDAVILKKPIITLKSKYLDHNSSRGSDRYAKHIGILQLDIDNFLDYNIKMKAENDCN